MLVAERAVTVKRLEKMSCIFVSNEQKCSAVGARGPLGSHEDGASWNFHLTSPFVCLEEGVAFLL